MDYTEVDILVRDRNNLYVTIEMQVLPHVGFLERILYYASSAYRRNYGRKDIAEETVEEQEGLKFA
ncbi:hypothetical protein CL176_02630 [Suicoccus acidiformans]|uniref:Uncharacterized protein n=1 Tax=Suicoccus acidiformans TaxID=2036206 RepID=A0A347WIV1_9LACT|nr:PD-(D/E)XK nuclease family transposase [Suicoccus acidiformans]AXY25008.1 hypothetical protein CL176_02630 [Suicoccus acidiformans]